MKTIKFRGKSINKNEWVNGDLVVVEDGMHNVVRAKIITHCFTKSFQGGDFDHYSISTLVQPETIGQFTGLLDENGTEIYEGDIVRSVRYKDFVYKVVYDNRFASFCLDRKQDMYKHYFGEAMEAENCEVIGNIHDNPELLKNND